MTREEMLEMIEMWEELYDEPASLQGDAQAALVMLKCMELKATLYGLRGFVA